MPDQSPHPYEMHPQGGAGFTVFEAGEAVGLPLLHLNKATLRGAGGLKMTLEFSAAQVVVEGEGLAELFGHLLAGKVKTIRRGTHGVCVVTAVQVLDV
ncbi:MAG: hypothetical protein HYV95_03750 [Opitutae bacterium]|nr:hypothetical protein [Opitutae bacterium]